MSVIFAQQVRNQLAGSLAHAERRKQVTTEVFKIAVDALSEFIPLLGAAKTITGTYSA